MENVVDSLWRIDEMPVIDESTKSYTYNEIRESNINVKELEQYTLETNISGWKHLSGAYIFVKSKIKNNPNNYATISNNGINDFDYVRLFYEEVLIEETNYVGIATLISNLIEFSGDVSDTSASQLCWYPDTADSADTSQYKYDAQDKSEKFKDLDVDIKTIISKITNNSAFNKGYLERWSLTKDEKTITKFIPLSKIFRFVRDCNKVLNGKIRIELRKNRVKNILHAKVDGNYDYEISDISLWIPIVKPSLETEKILSSLLVSKSNFLCGWNVSHIYQRPSGDVLIVVKNLYYLIDFPSFNVKSGYNGQSIENLGIPKGKRIDAIFRTYSGKKYIFYDKVLYIEFDECLFRSKKNGLISELFAGIPPNISRAFRYRNLYFFKDKVFYEFDDISNTLVKSDKFDLTVFGFKCGLIDQIIKLINRL
jgi:hypothetical protein